MGKREETALERSDASRQLPLFQRKHMLTPIDRAVVLKGNVNTGIGDQEFIDEANELVGILGLNKDELALRAEMDREMLENVLKGTRYARKYRQAVARAIQYLSTQEK